MNGEQQRNEPEAGQPEAITVPKQANAETGGEADSAGRKARILILEDEAWDAALAQRLLVSAGLNLVAVVVDTEAAFIEQMAAFQPERSTVWRDISVVAASIALASSRVRIGDGRPDYC